MAGDYYRAAPMPRDAARKRRAYGRWEILPRVLSRREHARAVDDDAGHADDDAGDGGADGVSAAGVPGGRARDGCGRRRRRGRLCVSTLATMTLEEWRRRRRTAEWFQLYVHRTRADAALVGARMRRAIRRSC